MSALKDLLAENTRTIGNIINGNYPYEDCDVDYQLICLKKQIKSEVEALKAQIDEINQRLA